MFKTIFSKLTLESQSYMRAIRKTSFQYFFPRSSKFRNKDKIASVTFMKDVMIKRDNSGPTPTKCTLI